MLEFVMKNPGATVVLMGTLVALIIYLFKKNESTTSKMIADKLDAISAQLNRLFQYNDSKEARISAVEDKVARLEQRCDDREKNCPGDRTQKVLDRILNGKGNHHG